MDYINVLINYNEVCYWKIYIFYFEGVFLFISAFCWLLLRYWEYNICDINWFIYDILFECWKNYKYRYFEVSEKNCQ
jgi:hypothetical protein